MSRSEIVSRDPCSGEIVWRGVAATSADLDAAANLARDAFSTWAVAPLEARIDIARRFAALVKERRAALATLISRETGKPYWETLTEVDSVAGKVEISIRAQAERAGVRETLDAALVSATRHKPHGVLAVIGPFNFPMHLPNGHITPALLAGNAVLFKPSEKAPASGVAMGELWRDAGLPEGVLQTLVGGGDLGAGLASHGRVDGVLFTGGVGTGLALHRAMAETPHKILALELGGSNPLIVWDAADVESAAHLIAQSAYLSAGQRCSCARRLIVGRGVDGERVVDALAGVIDRLKVGRPFDEPQPFMGPVIDQVAAQSLIGAQARLAQAGGRPLRPLALLEPDRPFLSPGLVDVTAVTERPDEEAFGPLLQLVRVDDFDMAIAEANRTRFGLTAGLISDDEALYRRFWAQARAGVVNWNRPTTGASSAAPFGGVGLSGNHRPSAYYAADYCAYPVASLEMSAIDFRIPTGLQS
jgi:succinylglutamic semialdehyde dehydrogenase